MKKARPTTTSAPTLDADIRFIKGIGPKRAEALSERGIRTVEDLLYHLPLRHEDRGSLQTIRSVKEGEVVTVFGRVTHVALQRTRRRGFSILNVAIEDDSGTLRVVFFNMAYLKDTLERGSQAIFHGPIARDRRSGGIQLRNPSFELDAAPTPESSASRLVPIHGKLPGFTPRGLRKLLDSLLRGLREPLPPSLPEGLPEKLGLGGRRQALREVHFPSAGASLEEFRTRSSPFHQRLIFDELFAMQLAFLLRRRELGQRPVNHVYTTSPEIGDRLRELLPFRLTEGQRAAFKDIVDDLKGAVPMARLVQGDVGSGKTIVALLAMLLAKENGFQAALMAPTELLAEQHVRGFRKLLGNNASVGLLTGSLPAAERKQVLAGLASGSLPLVVGTHALFQESVSFANLALVIVDEQHRFGLDQRARLASKGENPDVLIMTATPIPRTLSLTLHGDMDVSTIKDRPPGRKPIRTVVRTDSGRAKVLSFLDDQLAEGRQAYVVHPLIEEGEEDDIRAAEEGAAELGASLPGRRIGLVHGRLKNEERDEVMRAFVRGDVDVLVATTVIEVGVDVPNATVMLIENADRFGLAQLHQLRGRVGRGELESWCILMQSRQPTEVGQERLEMLVASEDGFELARADLAMRGAGEFFGARQAGMRDLRLADPVRDAAMLETARHEARAWLDSLSDAELESEPLILAVKSRWEPAVERSSVG